MSKLLNSLDATARHMPQGAEQYNRTRLVVSFVISWMDDWQERVAKQHNRAVKPNRPTFRKKHI